MNKNLSFIYSTIFFIVLFAACKTEDPVVPGFIYGTVTDKATGEPIPTADIELSPLGKRTITGSDGQYEFAEIPPGDYKLKVTKTGYTDLMDFAVVVQEGKPTKTDIPLERVPMSLRIVDGTGADISSLDFGAKADVTSRTFSIFNNSSASFTWSLSEDCDWITSVVSTLSGLQEGTLAPGLQEPIKVTINRNELKDDQIYTYVLNINSNAGSKELAITVGEIVGLPTMTTDPVSNIASTSATFNGTIVAAGEPAYIERGFVYGLTSQPTYENNKGRVNCSLDNKANFSYQVLNLEANTIYYVRAFAKNVNGVAYGNNVSFSTINSQTKITTMEVSDIGVTSAQFNAEMKAVGDPAYTECGFVYSTNEEPTIDDFKCTVAGSSVGIYTYSASGLAYNTTYYVRAYAIQNGNVVYGNVVSFQTSWKMTSLTTAAVTNITTTTATLNAIITEIGDPSYSERGFVYSSENDTPTAMDSKVSVYGSGEDGSYSTTIDNLSFNTTYYVRAYAIQAGQYTYGNVKTFQTIYTATRIITLAASDIYCNSATLNLRVEEVGYPECSECGWVYSSTVSVPTLEDATKLRAISYPRTGAYYNYAYNLNYRTSYYVRAYALQNDEPIYGDVITFTTKWNEPEFAIDPVTDIYSNNATLHCTLTYAGEPQCSEIGWVYSTSKSNPTLEDATKLRAISYPSTGAYYNYAYNLVSNTKYYVRVYVKQETEVYYSNTLTFTTSK